MAETEMVERVARAIETGDGQDPDERVFTPDGFQSRWRLAVPAARAAIEEMRKPTDAMVDAMNEHAGSIAPEYAWSDAIDAALSPPPRS